MVGEIVAAQVADAKTVGAELVRAGKEMIHSGIDRGTHIASAMWNAPPLRIPTAVKLGKGKGKALGYYEVPPALVLTVVAGLAVYVLAKKWGLNPFKYITDQIEAAATKAASGGTGGGGGGAGGSSSGVTPADTDPASGGIPGIPGEYTPPLTLHVWHDAGDGKGWHEETYATYTQAATGEDLLVNVIAYGANAMASVSGEAGSWSWTITDKTGRKVADGH